MDQLTKAQRRDAAERLTALLDMIAAGAIEATTLETAYLSGSVQGLRGELEATPAQLT